MKETPERNEVVVVALSSAFKGRDISMAKAALADGSSIEGEMTVRLPFLLTKGFGTEIRPTASIMSQAVLAKALVFSGITAEAFKQSLLRSATEALLHDHQVAPTLTEDDKPVPCVI